jgi:Protein of unknown function (DUF3043)
VKLGRRETVTDELPAVAIDDGPAEPAGKGRPTPKRADARKARRGTVPKNSKEATALRRERSREQRRLARQALQTGDERNLPARDAGPERRLARDIVDSRFTVGQMMFVLIFVALLFTFVHNSAINLIATVTSLLAITAMLIDSARIGRKAKMSVIERYGEREAIGISSYAFMRSMSPRRFRRPPPAVQRGDALR